MIFQLASIWLVICLLFCTFAWVSGKKWLSLILPVAAILTAYAIYLPMGSPSFTKPPKGKYEVLWADIQVDNKILVLLQKDGSDPVYYILPYSDVEANDLQSAISEGGEGGEVKAEIDGNGGGKYDGDPPVKGNPPK